MKGLPVVTTEQLSRMPWSGLLAGPTVALFLLLALPEWVAAWLAVSLSGVGLLLGLYYKYRARFGVCQSIVMPSLLAAYLTVISAGTMMVSVLVNGRPDLIAPAGVATLVLMLLVFAAGLLGHLRVWAYARRQGCLAQRLAPYADLDRRVLRRAPDRQPSSSSRWPLGAVAIGAPVGTWLVASGQRSLIVLIGCAMVLLTVYIVLRLSPSLALYITLLRWERENGFTFESDQRAELARIRRAFRLSRWLCRAEELAEIPGRAQVPRTAGRRGSRRRRRRGRT